MSGFILWEGPSPVDGKPLVCIATKTVKKGNKKVGKGAWQTWIIRADIHPVEAMRAGKDRSVCGNCIHRPTAVTPKIKRSCYVALPVISSVYNAYKRGRYSHIDSYYFGLRYVNDYIRLGAYGDPAMIPFQVTADVLYPRKMRGLRNWSGYTHQWRELWYNPQYSQVLMLSADSIEQLQHIEQRGHRGFLTLPVGSEVPKNTSICPASKEYQTKVKKSITCGDCQMCNGNSTQARSMTIIAHGNGKKYFTPLEVAQ